MLNNLVGLKILSYICKEQKLKIVKSSKTLINKINKNLNKRGLSISKVDNNTISVGISNFDLLNDYETNFILQQIKREMEGKPHLRDVQTIYFN